MAIDKDSAVENARNDLARRLKINAADVKQKSVEDSDFPDMALGAAEDGEMSGQMITNGWRIKLEAQGKTYEYRADKNQVSIRIAVAEHQLRRPLPELRHRIILNNLCLDLSQFSLFVCHGSVFRLV